MPERVKVALWMICAASMAMPASAATRRVCHSGCAYTNLQQAINDAQPGDTVLLRAGETFAGHYVLPVKSGTGWITIRSDAADTQLPPAGTRLVPSGRTGANTSRSLLARIVGLGGRLKTTPLLRTAAGAHHYRIEFIEFDGSASLGYETIVQIGTDTTAAPPTDIILDRVYVHGHKTKGQKRGIAINGVRCDVINSYISDIKAYNVDSQAILGYNGAGPFKIINNYVEASGENIMFGGADPAIVNLVPGDITIRHNHIVKPLAWRSDVLSKPGSVSATATTGGVLGARTHYFKVVALMDAGGSPTLKSMPSAEAKATTGSSGAVRLSWSGVTGADRYRIYRGTSSGAESRYLETSGASTSFTYTGNNEKSGTPPTHGTRWSIKNLLELKNAQRVLVEGNIIENVWAAGQAGYAIMLTPRNSSGAATWTRVRDVTIRSNIIRHASGAINILGRDDTATSGRTENITIANNLFTDIDNSKWGGLAKTFLLGGGPAYIKFKRNTIVSTDSSIVYAYGSLQIPGFVYTNNLAKHNKYGILGSGLTPGSPTIAKYFPSANVTCNVFAGGPASAYPKPNAFPSLADWSAAFVDPASGDYRLRAGSVIAGLVCNSLVPGVSFTALNTALAIGGDDGGGDPPPSTTNATPVPVPGGPYAGVAGSVVSVNGSASTDPDGTIASWRWGWGEDVLMRAKALPPNAVHGSAWKPTAMTGAAGSVAMVNPDRGAAKVATPLASPSSYVEFTVHVAAGVPYRLWLRMRAQDNRYTNDSLYVQLSGATTTGGAAIARIGTTSALAIVLEEGGGAGVSGWGWADASYGGMAAPIMFATSGAHKIRIQAREDGVIWDQFLLSSAVYRAKAPGPARADTTILPWAFGTTSGVTAAHTYTRKAVYPLVLTVLDNAGARASAVTTVTIGGSASSSTSLTANAGGPYSGTVNSAVVFDGRASRVPSGVTAKYGWLFGDDVVLHADDFAGGLHGRWQMVSDTTAADGKALVNADRRDAKVATPKASPANYVETTFDVAAGVPYMVWIRMRAEDDYWLNDSIWLQFSGSTDSAGRSVYRIGTTSALPVILEEFSGAGESGWGWTDARYGGLAAPLYFDATGDQTIRIQQREDGVRIDQVVISAARFQSSAPGAARRDATILPEISASATGSLIQHVYDRKGTYPVTLVLSTPDEESTSTTTAEIGS